MQKDLIPLKGDSALERLAYLWHDFNQIARPPLYTEGRGPIRLVATVADELWKEQLPAWEPAPAMGGPEPSIPVGSTTLSTLIIDVNWYLAEYRDALIVEGTDTQRPPEDDYLARLAEVVQVRAILNAAQTQMWLKSRKFGTQGFPDALRTTRMLLATDAERLSAQVKTFQLPK